MSREALSSDQAKRIYDDIVARMDALRDEGGSVKIFNRHDDDVERAIGKVDMPSWDRVVRAQLKERGLEYANDDIYEIILRLSGSIAADRIKGVEARSQKQVAALHSEYRQKELDRKKVFQPFVELLSPLVELGLMPGDEIISVAVRDSGGDVRIISVGERNT
jgi:hypothetical protein